MWSAGRAPGLRLVVSVGLSSALALAQSPSQSEVSSSTKKRAEEVYENIQVLKGVAAETIPPTMQFISLSLGVGCAYCHVRGENEKDDKEEKQIARQMMQMVLEVNQDSFEGRTEVTCYTCHRGHEDPVGVPLLSDAGSQSPTQANEPEQPAVPEADQLLDRFIAAMGGAEALGQISSRVATGSVLEPDGSRAPVEMLARESTQRVLIIRGEEGTTAFGYDGASGWTLNPERGVRDMSDADVEGSKLEFDLYLATQVKRLYSRWRVRGMEQVGGRAAYELSTSEDGRPPLRLFLDSQTGLPLRLIRYTVTPLGRLPYQVDYADYRDQDGVKVPYRITLNQRNGLTAIQFDQIRQNVPVDEAKFSKPISQPAH